MLLPCMVVFSYLSKNAMENQPLELTIWIGGLLNGRTPAELTFTNKSLFQAGDKLYSLKIVCQSSVYARSSAIIFERQVI